MWMNPGQGRSLSTLCGKLCGSDTPFVHSPGGDGNGAAVSTTSRADDLQEIWQVVLSNLLNDASITAHQKGFLTLAVPKALVEGQLVVLSVRNELTRTTLETHLREPLAREFSAALGHDVTFAIAVDPALDVPVPLPQDAAEATPAPGIPAVPAPASDPSAAEPLSLIHI